MPNLRVFGATEFMDSAISVGVLAELILRGLPCQISESRGRSTAFQRELKEDEEIDDAERRAECKPLEALDLCGCIGTAFVTSLQQFTEKEGLGIHYMPTRSSRICTSVVKRPPTIPVPLREYPGLKRLGLCGVTSVPSSILSAFVCSFPSLTHLDLTSTRCSPTLLEALAASPTIHLYSLSLSRCSRLTSESIAAFLIEGGAVTEGIRELSLYGNVTNPCPLTRSDLKRIITEAKCFVSGQLEYLDLSGTSLDKSHLAAFLRQPALRSLGLNFLGGKVNVHPGTEGLALADVSEFLLHKAPNVEIVTLVGSTPELTDTVPSAGRNTYDPVTKHPAMMLHSQLIQPLCSAPFVGAHPSPISPPEPPTKLRVIELSISILTRLSAPVSGWEVVKSRGGRAWYVDSTTFWVDGVLRRGLCGEKGKEVRQCLERWACEGCANGVGWHARKMEVLHGQGMFGREDGFYGAVSFAYMG